MSPRKQSSMELLLSVFEGMIDDAAESMTAEEFAATASKAEELLDQIAKRRATSIPRRARMDSMVPAELAIFKAVDVVEALGASVLLTEAVNLLHQARNKVADYVDARLPPTEHGLEQ